MELRQLQYFQMVCRLGTVTRAAEQLHTSQPNITASIRNLEEELGVALFGRTKRRLTLTPEGQLFLQRIEVALAQISDALLELSDYRNLKKGLIKIGIPPMIGVFLFPEIFLGFQQLYPELEMSIFEDGSLRIRSMLESGELDVGIVIITGVSAELNVIPMTRSQILACVAPDHPLASQKAIRVPDLKGRPLILLKENAFLRQTIFQECARHGFKPWVLLGTNQIETIKNLVIKGVGISFLFDMVAQREPELIGRPMAEPLYVDIGLAWKKDKYLSAAAQAFIGFVQERQNRLFGLPHA